MPLMNILAAGVGEPCAVLSIVDGKFFVCLRAMANSVYCLLLVTSCIGLDSLLLLSI